MLCALSVKLRVAMHNPAETNIGLPLKVRRGVEINYISVRRWHHIASSSSYEEGILCASLNCIRLGESMADERIEYLSNCPREKRRRQPITSTKQPGSAVTAKEGVMAGRSAARMELACITWEGRQRKAIHRTGRHGVALRPLSRRRRSLARLLIAPSDRRPPARPHTHSGYIPPWSICCRPPYTQLASKPSHGAHLAAGRRYSPFSSSTWQSAKWQSTMLTDCVGTPTVQ